MLQDVLSIYKYDLSICKDDMSIYKKAFTKQSYIFANTLSLKLPGNNSETNNVTPPEHHRLLPGQCACLMTS